jgi:serine/threonine protein kinase
MSSCSICYSEGTNNINCPLNPKALNPDCNRHYNAKIIQRVRNHAFKKGATDCRDDSYNPVEIASVEKTRCEDKKITGDEYYIRTSPGYRFLKTNYLCGQGSFKRVFLARDLKQDIKSDNSFVILSELEITKEAARAIGISFGQMSARLINEVKVMTNNDHPNVIKSLGSWYESNTKLLTVITEHLVGGDLEYIFTKRLVDHFRFTKIELSKMFKDILNGLAYIHTRRLIHRDLKPGNIGIADNGNLKLFDFGLTSKELDVKPNLNDDVPSLLRQVSATTNEPANALGGTPEYMAPEILNQIYNEKIDIYAFGIIALEFIAFRNQLSKSPIQELIKIDNLYTSDASKSQILKAEYRRFLELSDGLNLDINDSEKIEELYLPYGNSSAQFRNLVEDCIVHPEQRLSAKELLSKYWVYGKILNFGR